MSEEGFWVRFRRSFGLLAQKANERPDGEPAPSLPGLAPTLLPQRLDMRSAMKPSECIVQVRWELPQENAVFGANLPTEAEPSIGLIEFSSVAVGMKVCDQMLKNAPVTLLEAATICPGRFVSIMHGDAVAVDYAMTTGLEQGGENILDSLYIPDISQDVLAALSTPPGQVDYDSLGIVETSSVAAIIVAADVMTKLTDVHLLRIKMAKELGGKAYAIIGGTLGEVEICLQAATDAVASSDKIVQVTIIPVPDQTLLRKLNLPFPNQYRTQDEEEFGRKEVGLRYGTHA